MNTPARLGVYALGLAVAFTSALGAGRLAGPLGEPAAPRASTDHGDNAGHGEPGQTGAAAAPGGLQVADGGYRLVPLTPALSAGDPTELTFQIVGPDGAPVTGYTPTHDKDLHLTVVRRDLSGFQHRHPTRDNDGTWRIPVTVAQPGQYRVFADFQPAGRDKRLTLGVDIPAAGAYQPQPLPAPARVADVDGYRVELVGALTPGTASKLTLRVSRDGRPVTDLQPYLAAYGHLVALRDGDLAYLHVHPDGAPGDGRTAAGPQITFYAEVPSVGAYRLYLDFQHNDTVRTAELTVIAGGAAAVPGTPGPAGPSPSGHTDQHGHG